VVSQLIVSVPLMALYEFGIFIAARTLKRMERANTAAKAVQVRTTA
jgi:Sec-independent protein secretion pathway component TatC